MKSLIRVVQVTDASGNDMKNVFGQVRQDGDRYHVVLMSMTAPEVRFGNRNVAVRRRSDAVGLQNGRRMETADRKLRSRRIKNTHFVRTQRGKFTISAASPAFARQMP